MEGLELLGRSLVGLLGPWQLLYALGATLTGIVIGILPGLSATLGIALFTTLTVRMPHTDAILILICVYVGAISRQPPRKAPETVPCRPPTRGPACCG